MFGPALPSTMRLPGKRAVPLIWRLIVSYALPHSKSYALAFVLMAIVAGCTAFTAYLFGDVINQVVLNRDLQAVIVLCGIIVVLFTGKGLATYGQAVVLARISNRIIAANQRLLFEHLIRQNLGFFTDRHSSEFMARLNVGAAAPSQVLNLVSTAVGRDFLSLVALLGVMVVQDPTMSLITLLIAPPLVLLMRKLIR